MAVGPSTGFRQWKRIGGILLDWSSLEAIARTALGNLLRSAPAVEIANRSWPHAVILPRAYSPCPFAFIGLNKIAEKVSSPSQAQSVEEINDPRLSWRITPGDILALSLIAAAGHADLERPRSRRSGLRLQGLIAQGLIDEEGLLTHAGWAALAASGENWH